MTQNLLFPYLNIAGPRPHSLRGSIHFLDPGRHIRRIALLGLQNLPVDNLFQSKAVGRHLGRPLQIQPNLLLSLPKFYKTHNPLSFSASQQIKEPIGLCALSQISFRHL